jgi:O-antigen/teichoic acid export membrane protein
MSAPTSPESRTIARMALRSTVWVSLGTYANILIGFVANIVLTRLLGPEVFGFFALASFWMTLLEMRSKAGLNYAAIQRPETDGVLLGTHLTLNLILAAASVSLCLITSFILMWMGYPQPVIVAVLVLALLDSLFAFTSPYALVLEKHLQLSRLVLMGLVGSLLAYGVALTLAWRGAGLWSLLAINAVTNSVAIISTYLICRRLQPQVFTLHWSFSWLLAKQLVRQGLPTGLSLTAIFSIVSTFDNFLVGQFVGYKTLGYYDRAFRTANWLNLLLTTVVTRVGFVTFAKVQNDLPRLTHTVRLALWLLTTAGIPLTLVLSLGAHNLIEVLYGTEWSTSANFMPPLVIYALAVPFINLGFWLASAVGQSRTSMLITVSQALAIIIFATPLTILFGVTGTLIGVGLSTIVALTLSCTYIFRCVPLSLNETLLKPLLAACVAASAVIAITSLFDWNGWWGSLTRLLLIGIVGTSLFLITTFALSPTEMRERIRYLRQTWRKV